MRIKSFSFRHVVHPQHGLAVFDDFELEKTRDDEEEVDLTAVKIMLESNSLLTIVMKMTLTLQGYIEENDSEFGGDTCCMSIHNPICEIRPEYVHLERKGRVYLEDMIEMMWLRIEFQRKYSEIKRLKENKFLGFKSLT